LIVDELANKGIIAASRFYESPFTDISAIGPDGLFTSAQVDEMVSIINDVKANAAA